MDTALAILQILDKYKQLLQHINPREQTMKFITLYTSMLNEIRNECEKALPPEPTAIDYKCWETYFDSTQTYEYEEEKK